MLQQLVDTYKCTIPFGAVYPRLESSDFACSVFKFSLSMLIILRLNFLPTFSILLVEVSLVPHMYSLYSSRAKDLDVLWFIIL